MFLSSGFLFDEVSVGAYVQMQITGFSFFYIAFNLADTCCVCGVLQPTSMKFVVFTTTVEKCIVLVNLNNTTSFHVTFL